MSDRYLSRREFFIGSGAILVVTAAGVACTSKSVSPLPAPGTIEAKQTGAAAISLLSSDSPVKSGKSYFGFDLTTQDGQLLTGGSPRVWMAPGKNTKAGGPFTATWHPFGDAYTRFHDHSPKSPLTGVYATEIDVPSTGNWSVAAEVSSGSHRAVGVGALPVVDIPIPAEVGTKATSVSTPVATTTQGLKQICTRNPPDPMHYVSLDKALTNSRPTVVTFATPLLCTSKLCGPVVDEQLAAFTKIGGQRANFIHVEEFLPGPSLKPPPATAENTSPAFKAWKFQSEPWTIVIDKHGIIQGRFEGPFTAPQIEAAVQPLL